MNVDKNITLDLNRVQPLKVIKIHEGDVNSVRLVITITKDNQAVDLTAKTVKYDATISNILAEQDALGSISGSQITIPITKNMTAHSGLLKIDVKIIDGAAGSSVLYTQTLTLIVERSVITNETIIDASNTTIEQKFNAIDLKFEGLSSEFCKQDEVDRIISEKMGGYYTSQKVDSLLIDKVNHAFANDATLENCDRFTDWNTVYHLYINGTYQILLNTSNNGGQYRFTRTGEIFFRAYNYYDETWSEWNNMLNNIPNNTITGSMIIDDAVTYDKLRDEFLRYYENFNLDHIDAVNSFGVYTGKASNNWISEYGVYGNYVLLATDCNLLFFPSCNRLFVRYRSSSGAWMNWYDISPCAKNDLTEFLKQETGTVGKNYAWYTDESQGYSLTGTYTLIGNMCYLHGKAPLINGWGKVYYSLPVSCTAPSSTIALCNSDFFAIATGTISNVSVLEIKSINLSTMPSGDIYFTLIYKYK